MQVNTLAGLTFNAEDFRSSADAVNIDTVRFRLTGDPGISSVETIGKLLTGLHAYAVRSATKQIKVDLKELQFMNSSCFKKFVSWINAVVEMPAATRYKITILSDPKIHWQKRSLHAFQSFAPEIVTIES